MVSGEYSNERTNEGNGPELGGPEAPNIGLTATVDTDKWSVEIIKKSMRRGNELEINAPPILEFNISFFATFSSLFGDIGFGELPP